VTLELRVLRGARAGQREQFAKSLISLGRNPLCDFRFDAQLDLDVSARHAEIEVVNAEYVLRDTQSTNGTFVNGARIPGNWVLRDGDVLTFGAHGPQVAVRLLAPPYMVRDTTEFPKQALGSTSPALRGLRLEKTGPVGAGAPKSAAGSTTERIAVAVRAHTRQLQRWAVGALALVVIALITTYWIGRRDSDRLYAELTAKRHENDSLQNVLADRVLTMSSQMAGIDSALSASRMEIDRLQSELKLAGRGSDAKAIASQLSRSETKRHEILSAAISYPAIAQRSGPAVVLVAVQWPDGHSFSGSGFGVNAAGYIVTNRHLVTDSNGHTPRQVLLIFSDTKTWLPAHVVRSSTDADLALLQIDAPGSYPVVGGIAHSTADIPVGAQVAIIGYPLGTETPMEGSGTKIIARSTLVAGTVSKHLDDVLQVDAYAGEGSSGSPVFAPDGRVIGVVYGGAREAAGRIVYAVPADKIAALIAPR
jgi:S1-C subfamily serine protease